MAVAILSLHRSLRHEGAFRPRIEVGGAAAVQSVALTCSGIVRAGYCRHHLRPRVADEGDRDDVVVMRAVDSNGSNWKIRRRWIPSGRARIADVRIADLLAHVRPDRLPAVLPGPHRRIDFQRPSPPCRRARVRSRSSDLGFILLGFILEDAQPISRLPGRAGCDGSLSPARRPVQAPGQRGDIQAARFQAAAKLARSNGTHRKRSVARASHRW